MIEAHMLSEEARLKMLETVTEITVPKGRTHTDATKIKISRAKKGKYCGENHHLFGKKLTEEHKKKISDAKKGKYCGENSHLFGKKLTEEHKKKLSEAKKGKYCGKNSHLFGRKLTKKQKDHLSKLATKQLQDDSNFGYARGRIHYIYYKNQRMRSKWELNFAKRLDELNIQWSYEQITFVLDNGRKYIPDFYLPDLDLFIEIKPSCFIDKKAVYKLKNVILNKHKIYFLTEKNWDILIGRIELASLNIGRCSDYEKQLVIAKIKKYILERSKKIIYNKKEPMPQEIRDKISKSLMGRKRTEKDIEIARQGLLRYYQSEAGKKRKTIMSKKMLGKNNASYGTKTPDAIKAKAVLNRKNNNGGNYHSPGGIKLFKEKMTGRKLTKEHIEKIVKTRKDNGYRCSQETRRKMSDAKKGKKFTEEHKKKLSDAKKGKKLTEEHKKKISDAKKLRQLKA